MKTGLQATLRWINNHNNRSNSNNDNTATTATTRARRDTESAIIIGLRTLNSDWPKEKDSRLCGSYEAEIIGLVRPASSTDVKRNRSPESNVRGTHRGRHFIRCNIYSRTLGDKFIKEVKVNYSGRGHQKINTAIFRSYNGRVHVSSVARQPGEPACAASDLSFWNKI